jgi:hypothetical protein
MISDPTLAMARNLGIEPADRRSQPYLPGRRRRADL